MVPAKNRNLPLFLIIALPAFAILASVGTAVVAFSRGDAPLPDQYHWEGDKLDHDFALSDRARALQIEASLSLTPELGLCHLSLQISQPPPPVLRLQIIHASRPELDRQLRFARSGAANQYVAPCGNLPEGRWNVELADADHSWSIRQETSSQPDTLHLSAIADSR